MKNLYAMKNFITGCLVFIGSLVVVLWLIARANLSDLQVDVLKLITESDVGYAIQVWEQLTVAFTGVLFISVCFGLLNAYRNKKIA
jgi:uncharacterized membrane protein (Fun14 family)